MSEFVTSIPNQKPGRKSAKSKKKEHDEEYDAETDQEGEERIRKARLYLTGAKDSERKERRFPVEAEDIINRLVLRGAIEELREQVASLQQSTDQIQSSQEKKNCEQNLDPDEGLGWPTRRRERSTAHRFEVDPRTFKKRSCRRTRYARIKRV